MNAIGKAVGSIGRWDAHIDGQYYPCVHDVHFTDGRYHDRSITPGKSKKGDEFAQTIAALRTVIITFGEKRRKGYISLCRVDDVVCDEDGLRFTIVETIGAVH